MKTYVYALKRYVKYTGKDPMTSKLDDILNYQYEIIEKNVVSFSTYRVNCCALRFFYSEVHPQDWKVEKIPFPKKETRLPTVLSMYDAMQVITQIKPFQVRAMLQLIFATGMRFNEARNLKVAHIDGQRSCIRIVRGKGGVDREIPLKPTVRKLLQIIYKKRPQK
jgi:site-specific recombinase XerD